MRLVVGLGNPGREYAGTRHNVGFEVIDRLAEKLGWTGPDEFDRMAKTKFNGLAMDGAIARSGMEDQRIVLLKPLTYMNLSGQAVQAAMGFFQLSHTDVMIVLDDLALACGKLRIRPGGSDGGHNGLRDIQRVLGTNQYPRLRLGIDAPPPPVPGKQYVLGKFTPGQRTVMDEAVSRAAGAILTWIEKGIATAMNQFNVVMES